MKTNLNNQDGVSLLEIDADELKHLAEIAVATLSERMEHYQRQAEDTKADVYIQGFQRTADQYAFALMMLNRFEKAEDRDLWVVFNYPKDTVQPIFQDGVTRYQWRWNGWLSPDSYIMSQGAQYGLLYEKVKTIYDETSKRPLPPVAPKADDKCTCGHTYIYHDMANGVRECQVTGCPCDRFTKDDQQD